MSTQNYVKKGKPYTARITVAGLTDPASVCLFHEWGDPVSASTKIISTITSSSTTVDVDDASIFSVNDSFIFSSGKQERNVVDIIDGNTITFSTDISGSHQAGSKLIKLYESDVDGDNYSYSFTEADLNSSGRHIIRWVYEGDNGFVFVDQPVMVYQPYITAAEFFDLHPELEDEFDDTFDSIERRIRNRINTYCGQTFDSYRDKTQTYDGSGTDKLNVGTRIYNVSAVVEKPDVDLSTYVRINNDSKFFITIDTSEATGPDPWSSKFSAKRQYEIRGDWGWPTVPDYVTQAADLLLLDEMNNDSNYVKHGVKTVQLDGQSIGFADGIYDSTGNLDADVLLLDYTIFPIGVI